jgi:hypothetical protein
VKEAARSAASFLLLRILEKLLQEICSGFGGFFIDASQALYESLLIYRAHLIYDQLTLSFLKLAGDAGR